MILQSFSKNCMKQESIPVGCVVPTCQPYVVQWPRLDVSIGGGEGGPQVNKFEQASRCWWWGRVSGGGGSYV